MRLPRTCVAGVLAVAAVALTACTADPVPAGPAGGPAAPVAAPVAAQERDQALHDRLPEHIRQAGKIVAVNTGSFPPYTIVSSDEAEVEGATAELGVALGQILGVEIEHTTIDGLASVLSGMQAQRYDLDLGPVGDFPERQEQATFVDWVQEYVVFAVQKGNPKGIVDVESACGTRVAVQAAGSAEKVIKEQSDACAAAGKPAIEVQSYKDQPSSILAVQSNRADAFFSSQAPLTYFVQQSGGQLELAGQGKPNGFDDLYQGAVVPKDSPLAGVLLEAIQRLHDNGTYEAIMTKWGLEGNMLDAPGINLGKA